jgi:hypothetical protein
MSNAGINRKGEGVDAAVDRWRPVVHERLRELERERDLRVLFACESGSRAWGFASKDSDFDVRFIFVRRPVDYVRLRPPADAFDVVTDGELDLAGWDVRKTAELLYKCNVPLMEWIESPIVYEADGSFHATLRAFRDEYFDVKRAAFHYLKLAQHTWDDYIAGEAQPRRKKYLYALRPLACEQFVETHRAQPPTEFAHVLAGIELPVRVREAIETLLAQKRGNDELGAAPADEALNGWIVRMLESGRRFAEAEPARERRTAPLDAFLAEVILAGAFGHTMENA